MQTVNIKTSENKKKEKSKLDVPAAPKKEDKLKKSLYTVSTPRNYALKSSTADIYGQKNPVQSARAPKKTPSGPNKTSNVSPIKNLLKSSPSSISQLSTGRHERKNKTSNLEPKTPTHTVSKETPRKKLPFTNITVNSPIVKRKLNLDLDEKKSAVKELPPRQRTKTRTLQDGEIKVLTPEVVDNNAEMLNLSRRLTANPKSFYVGLDGEGSNMTLQKDKSTDEEVSYEDDFESYESDFESYHSESKQSDENGDGDGDRTGDDEEPIDEEDTKGVDDDVIVRDSNEFRNEERMLDSGNFDLKDSQRSANKKPAVMAFIKESSEDMGDKKVSLTDEGFQDMSSSSAVSSLKTVHVDIMERPLFIDFTKSRENKRKRRINEYLKQRAKDLLGMITLHEISYTLFEMKPISYDLFMATFGRSNYLQTAVQTYDDGVTEETQTDEITSDHKWTQHPVEFSNNDVYLNINTVKTKYSTNEEHYLSKFTLMLNERQSVDVNHKINEDLNYKSNPLRVYLEQKNGVGSGEMLPYDKYKSKLSNNEYNPNRLNRFLNKLERRVCNILTKNMGNTEFSDMLKSARFPFSKGYFTVTSNNVSDVKISFLKNSKITQIYFSETKSSFLMTVHINVANIGEKRCVLCLWDVSVARRDPVKILVAIDNVTTGKLTGSTDGLFVAALEDRSIHLWDLSEEPTWRGVASEEFKNKLADVSLEHLTEFERDREWNLQNSSVGLEQEHMPHALQASAFTNSAGNLSCNDVTDAVVGLEVVGESWKNQDGCRKVLGQVISLQRLGLLTIWLVIQDKSKTSQQDMGKAYWSRMRLEKNQTLSLLDHYDSPQRDLIAPECSTNFNLIAAKRRISKRKTERSLIKEFSRPGTATSRLQFDRPVSGASINKVLPDRNKLNHWENVLVCNDLKVMRLDNVDHYLIAKNYGEVVSCKKSIGIVSVRKFTVANDTSSITCLRVSPHNLPYFLAATDTGTVNLCSIKENRVLLTLDVRNVPERHDEYKCQSDHKGRFISSVLVRSPGLAPSSGNLSGNLSIATVLWSSVNPCYIFTLLRDGAIVAWDLTHSDINAKCASEKAAVCCCTADSALALLTTDGEVQIHRLDNEHRTQQYLQLFEKYIALL